MVIGVFGAASQFEIRAISLFISSARLAVVMGLALFSIGVGTIFYVIHNMVASNLFLVGGAIQHIKGSTHLKKIGGPETSAPLHSVLISAMSLAGARAFWILCKICFDCGAAGEQWLMCGVGLFVGLLTLYSMTRLGQWILGTATGGLLDRASIVGQWFALLCRLRCWRLLRLHGPRRDAVFEFSDRAAVQLLDRTFYIEHVLGGGMK